MLSYTALEYGFPLSHSANAIGVILVFWWRLLAFRHSLSWPHFALLLAVLVVYYFSLIIGRLYCGMHGFVDLLSGSLVGVACFLVRFLWSRQIDALILENGHAWLTGVLVALGCTLLVHLHADPVDDCPCFDDSVAFIGVIIGVDWSFLAASSTRYFASLNLAKDPYLIPYSFEKLGLVKSALRVLLGMGLVVIWKSISKPLVFSILPPLYKLVRFNLPRRNYIATAFSSNTTRQIRSTSISNINMEENNLDVFGTVQDEVGPELESDYYELQFQRSHELGADAVSSPALDDEGLTRGKVLRYDVEVVGRLIIYAGIPVSAIWGFVWVSKLLDLN